MRCGCGEEWRRSVGRREVRNEEVLRRVGEQRTLINTIWRRKARWTGHVIAIRRTAENSHRRKSRREKTKRKEEEDDVG